MGKGTRAAGGAGRRRSGADSEPAQATQILRPAPGPQAPRQGQPSAAPPPTQAAQQGSRGGRPRAGRGATFSVVLMTLVALAAVGVLAAQAEATAPKVHVAAAEAAASKGTAKSGGTSSTPNATDLPANSGSGTRIVYSPSAHRVWLAEGSTVERTMVVVPGTIAPPAGTFSVYAKSPGSVGGDGVTVVDLVRFDSGSDSFGFDAEASVTGLPPAPKGSTGGVRMAQLDAQALYEFASVGTTVVVL